MDKMKAWTKLFRIKHYIKNTLIFFPLFFSGRLYTAHTIVVFAGSIVFSLASSIVYVINDIHDVEKDRVHPEKCKRPLAAGDISIYEAKVGLTMLFILTIVLLYCSHLDMLAIAIVGGYLLINIFYSKFAKNIPIIDVLILATGYLLRVYYGAQLAEVKVSEWMYFTVLFGALFLGLGKRRGESRITEIGHSRKVLELYNEKFLDKNMYMSLAITIVFYALWCVSEEVSSMYPQMIWTTVLVYAICMEYTLILEKGSDGDPVSVLFKNKGLLGMIVGLAIIILWIMYR